jgi:hypothetical protein
LASADRCADGQQRLAWPCLCLVAKEPLRQATASAPAASDQAVSDANAQLSTDLNGLSSDVQSLATDSDFTSVLTSYANDWSQMLKDYQTEQND